MVLPLHPSKNQGEKKHIYSIHLVVRKCWWFAYLGNLHMLVVRTPYKVVIDGSHTIQGGY